MIQVVRVTALGANGQPYLAKVYTPSADGRLDLGDLPAGVWTLVIRHLSLGQIEVAVEVPGDPITVTFPETGQ